jgi:hypothetical protein
MRGIAEGLHEFAKVAKPERVHPRTRQALALAPKDYRVLVTSASLGRWADPPIHSPCRCVN